MILRGWHIDAFGIFKDARVDDLPGGVTVIQGPNEAGKSTLLAFVRGVLFGFPDKRSNEPLHEPVHGGTRGGRLFLERDGALHTVERHAARKQIPRVLDERGEDLPDGALNDLLGGADKRLYRNVFGFTLDELADLRTLQDDTVRERIFSGAVAGAGRSARKAARELAEEAGALYNPDGRAKKNRVAELLRELRDVDGKLAEARREAEGYPQTVQAERDAEARVAAARDELARLQRRRDWLTKLQRLWEPWCAREEAVRALERERGTAFDRAAAIAPDDAFTALAGEADTLAAHADRQRERLDRVAELDREIAGLDERLRPTLATLGASWTEDTVAAFTLPIPARETVRAWERDLTAADQAVTDAEAALARARDTRDRAETERRRLERELRELGEEPPPEATLKARIESLEGLRGALAEHGRAQERARYDEHLLADRREHTAACESAVPSRLGHAVAAVVALAGCAGGAVLALSGRWIAGAVLAAAGVLAGVGGAVMLHGRRRSARARRDRAREREREAEQTASESRAAAERVRERVAELADEAGVEAALDDAGVVQAVERTRGRIDARRAWDAKKRELDDAAKHVENAAAEIDNAEAAASARQSERDDLAGRWAAWKHEHDFPTELTPQGVIDFAGELEQARRTVGEKHDRQRQRASVAQAVADWRARGRELVERWGGTPPAADRTLIDAVTATATAIDAARRRYGTIAATDDAVAREAAYDPETVAALKTALAAGDPDGWRRELSDLDDSLAAAQQWVEDAAGDQRAAREARERVEAASDVTVLETRRNALVTEMREAYRRWQTLTTAKTLIETTLATYERERQPAVVSRAGDHFARVTGGRHTGVVQSGDGGGVAVLDRAGRRLGPIDLSRGTREQLYLSLRLGLAAEFARRGTALPLVMDEILVNFDPDRMAAMARELHAVAETHQVLLFTCHPWVAEAVTAQGPARVVTELAPAAAPA